MKTLEKKITHEILMETYFGIGFGYTKIDGKMLFIFPFIIFLVIEKEKSQA